MPRFRIEPLVFLAGLAVVGWIGASYLGSNSLALAVTLLIGVCYLLGSLELWRYWRLTASFAQAIANLASSTSSTGLANPANPANLANPTDPVDPANPANPVSTPVPALDAWLLSVPASLRSATRLRIEGQRAALPAPALTAYLVGLLVLLGMLGTLLGMATTLRGTGALLGSATDPDAMRAALTAPIQGLGFAFGTSIAGVASSAALGLLSALCRTERAHTVQRLDGLLGTTLRAYSASHQREQTLQLLRRQVAAGPALADRLDAAMQTLERQTEASHERQLACYQAFLDRTHDSYADLTSAVKQALQDTAAQSAGAASEAVSRHLGGINAGITELWHGALGAHRETSQALADKLASTLDRYASSFEQRATALLEQVAAQQEAAGQRASAAWSETLTRTSREIAQQTGAQAGQTIEAVTGLVQIAADAPRAAATVIEEIRQQLADSMTRDTALLQEREQLLQNLGTVLDAVGHSAHQQNTAIETLVANATTMLERAGGRFDEQLQSETQKLGSVTAQVGASAVEVASLADAFGGAVQAFGDSSEKLSTHLQRIESALEKSLSRSDEQLAYYVAQAREVVDLSVMSQKQIVEDLQRLGKSATTATEAGPT